MGCETWLILLRNENFAMIAARQFHQTVWFKARNRPVFNRPDFAIPL